MKKPVFLLSAVLIAGGVAAGPASASVFSITADTSVSLSATKTSVTVTGTIVCTAGNEVNVVMNVLQNSGSVDTVSGGSAIITCTGQVQTWSATANVLIGSTHKKGPATLLFAGFDQTDGTSSQTVTQGVKIK